MNIDISKIKGIAVNIDPQGRILIPKVMRQQTGIDIVKRCELILTETGVIVIKPLFHVEECVFCGSSKELRTMQGATVCEKCASKIVTDVKEAL